MMPLGFLAQRRRVGGGRWIGLTDTPPAGASAVLLVMAPGNATEPTDPTIGGQACEYVTGVSMAGSVTTPYLSVWWCPSPPGTTLTGVTGSNVWSQVLWVEGLIPGAHRIGRNINTALPGGFAPDPLPHALTVGPGDLVLSMRTGRGSELIDLPAHDFFDTGADPPGGATLRSSRWTVGHVMPGEGWGYCRYSAECNLVLTPA